MKTSFPDKEISTQKKPNFPLKADAQPGIF